MLMFQIGRQYKRYFNYDRAKAVAKTRNLSQEFQEILFGKKKSEEDKYFTDKIEKQLYTIDDQFELEIPLDPEHPLMKEFIKGRVEMRPTDRIITLMLEKVPESPENEHFMNAFMANLFIFQMRDKFSRIESKFAKRVYPELGADYNSDTVYKEYKRDCWLNQLIFSNCLTR